MNPCEKSCRWATENRIEDATPALTLERLEAIRMEIYRIQRSEVYTSSAAYDALGEVKLQLQTAIDDIKANPPD